MTDPSLTSLPTLDEPGDAELISAVRAGDLEAYGMLFERHVEAARRLARQLVSAGDVDDLVSDAFSKVLGVLQKGGGPDLAFRAYLLTSLRRLHVDKIRATSRLTTTDDLTPYDPGVPFEDTAVSGFDNAAAAKAFAALPERWQQVLWHTEVEGQKPAEIAPLLGMSPNSVSALAYRAREGLRQAFISMHAQEALDDACARTRANLGAYIRSGLSKRDSAKVDAHLQECRECTAIYLELAEVNSNLGALLAPLLLGTAGAGYLAAAATGTKVGFLLFLGGAKNWILHNPVGRVTAGAAGVAAAAVVVAAVAMSGGNDQPTPASAPKPSTPASAPPAANPPTTTPPKNAPKNTPKNVAPPVAPPANQPAAPPAAPPPAPPSSSTPPAAPPQQAPLISTPLPAVNVTPGRSVVIDLTNGATDPDGDPLTVKSASVARPSHGTVRKGGKNARPVAPRLAGGKTGLSGSAPILARTSGGVTTVTYTPDAGWRGTDTIDYTLTDGHGGDVSGSVKVTTPNAAPVAKSYTVTANTGLTSVFPTWIWPLKHASDANGDALRLTFTQPTNGGRITAGPDGRLDYHPRSTATAYTDRFTYTVSDGHRGRDTATITVKVGATEPTPPQQPSANASLAEETIGYDDYEHVALTTKGVPAGATVTLTYRLEGAEAPAAAGWSACDAPAPMPTDGVVSGSCTFTNGQALHLDFTSCTGWKLTASIEPHGFSDPVASDDELSPPAAGPALHGPIDCPTDPSASPSTPSLPSAQASPSTPATPPSTGGTGNPSGMGTASNPSDNRSSNPSSDPTTDPTSDAPDDQPSLISKIVGALF